MKKIISLLLILTLLISTFTFVSADTLTYETIMHNVACRIPTEATLSDDSMEWYIADLASYNDAFEGSQKLISEDLKVQFINALINKAEEKSAPGDLAKIIIALRALGVDARKLYNAEGEQIDAVKKLTDLIDSRNESVINEYTLPYVIIALNQGENYASQEQMDYLLTSAINTQDAWKNLSWGYPDAATPMIFALSPYYNSNDKIKTAVDFAIETVKSSIDETGVSASNACSTGLAIAAFSAIGIDSTSVEINESNINVIDGVLTFATENGDGFKYGEEEASFATEQSFRGLVAYELLKNGKKLYDFYDYPMNEARKTVTENCTVTFNITPADAVLTVENAVPMSENTYALTEGVYNYSVSKEGYITKNDTLTITSEDILSGTKNVSIVLEEIESPAPDIPQTPTFRVRIRVMAHNENTCNNSLTYKDNASDYTEIVSEEFNLTESHSVLDILIKALRKNNISYTENNGYVSQINGVSEFEHGSTSGWMFKLNGLYQNKSAQEINVTDTATILWFYTDDYTREKGSENYRPSSSGGGGSSTKTEEKPSYDIEKTTESVLEFIKEAVKAPTFSQTGGEWTVLSLARSDIAFEDDYFDTYISNLKNYLDENNGILSENKYTEYSRVVIALSSLGINASKFYGYNLVEPICDFDSVTNQGINGAVWALIALDSADCDDEVKEKYIDYILSKQNPDGGWALSGQNEVSEVDMTAMAVVALSNYQNDTAVSNSIEKALDFLSGKQNKNGGFTSYGEASPESSAQVLVALCSLNIDYTDKRFVKNKKTLIDNILSFYVKNEGFSREKSILKTNLLTTEQCAYALVACDRFKNKKNTLFDMSDTTKRTLTENTGLNNIHEDITIPTLSYPNKTFTDISDSESKDAINVLAEYGIIHGISDENFAPLDNMTRAEFSAIIVKALSLPEKDKKVFNDVNEAEWYYDYINTAYYYGIVKGESENTFNPEGKITKAEALVMLERVAKLCGMENSITEDEAKDILAGFIDYREIPDWAYISFAFCCDNKIADDINLYSEYDKAVNREEIAQYLYNMLKVCKLI
ncbi:MAG: S-layer homology domain-containing protein [Clostridia bacterium]|nr:S-layer homology domain-containing protein [Clostridia bacterium]